MEFTIGIDEAGRGPVMGPLVVGIVVWPEQLELGEIEIRDSKKLTAKKRAKSREFIENNCDYLVISIPAWIISASDKPLQMLEAQVISDALFNFSEKWKVYSDALGSGNKAHRWIEYIHPRRKFCFESGADDRYLSVAAASIMAKTCRDNCMESIKKQWGEVGSGYPSDPKTKKWLQNYSRSGCAWPAVVRTSWKTVQRLEN